MYLWSVPSPPQLCSPICCFECSMSRGSLDFQTLMLVTSLYCVSKVIIIKNKKKRRRRNKWNMYNHLYVFFFKFTEKKLWWINRKTTYLEILCQYSPRWKMTRDMTKENIGKKINRLNLKRLNDVKGCLFQHFI